VEAWLWALGLGVVLFAVLDLAKRAVAGRFSRFAERTRTGVDDRLYDLLDATRRSFFAVVAVYVASRGLTLAPGVDRMVAMLLVVALALQSALWADRVLGGWLAARMAVGGSAQATGYTAVRFIGRWVLWSVILLVALDNLGVDVSALVASLGVGGIAVALAVQNILGDLFCSLSILFDKPFEVGDFIIVDDLMGTVERIGIKTTRVRSLGGEQLVFSNSDLVGSRIRNYKRMWERRVVFGFGVTYDTPPQTLERIPQIVREIVEQIDDLRLDRAHFQSFGDSALLFEVVYYVRKPDYNVYMDAQQEINLRLMRRLSEEGVEFAYPTQTLYLHRSAPVDRTG